MKPRQIEAFRAVIEAGGVTAAANRLRITQPAVSKLISELERKTRLVLFVRNKQRLVPTPEARLLYEEVDRVFLSLDRIERFAQDLRENRTGTLSIGCLPSLGLSIVPEVVAQFAADRPDVRLSFHVRMSTKIADWVLGQQIDLGISLLRIDHPSIDVELLTNAHAVCILPVGHALAEKDVITPDDLKDVPFIGLGREDQAEQMISRAFDRDIIPRRVQLETNLSAVACRLVSAGVGVSIVDPLTAAEFSGSNLLIKPFRPEISFDMWLLFPAHRPRSQLIDIFVKALRETITQKNIRFVG